MRKASSSSQTASKEVSLTLIGAIMSFEENTQQQSKAVTSHYWGYRELSAEEINAVGGGYDGNNGPSGGFGGASSGNTADSNNPGGTSGASGSSNPTPTISVPPAGPTFTISDAGSAASSGSYSSGDGW
jgi:hypothetical protein